MSGLGEFHHADAAEAKSSKLIHWIIGLVVIAGIAIFAVESGIFNSPPSQTTTYPRGL